MENLDVKVGDKVIIHYNYSDSVGVVEKVTPKGSIRVNGTLYSPSGSEKGGDSWSRTYITKATEEDIREIKQKRYTSNTLSILHHLRHLTYEQAVEIRKILDSEVVK